MRAISIFGLIVGMSALVIGCESRPVPAGASDTFASRFDAAKAINNNAMRADAMAQLALDAAAGGDTEIAKKAIESINSTAKKDEVAAKAARNLAKAGRGDDAVAVTRLIQSSALRDQTLAKIAKGEFDDKPAN